MKKMLLSATVAATALLFAAPASAEDVPLGETLPSLPVAGIKFCFPAAVSNIALLPLASFVESGIVIRDENHKEIIKANTNYGEKPVADYWTSKIPRNINLEAGCYNFHFLIKNTPPSSASYWACATPQAAYGPVEWGKDTQYSTITSAMGGGALTAVVMIPALPNKSPEKTSLCPSAS